MSRRSGTYVDNAQNRSLGRVGMSYGSSGSSASRSSSSSSYSSTSTSSSQRTYVDNSMNRSLGRVGMAHGTRVQSSTSSSASSSAPQKTYVDNATNRSLGRVGMPHGTHVQSSTPSSASSSAPQKTYVDNATNRSLGRVGMPHGTHVQSSSTKESSSTTQKCYADNSYNRRLARVGKPLGSHVVSTDGSMSISTGKTYVDNAMNRHLNRVGKPIKRKIQQSKERNITNTQCLEEIREHLQDLNVQDPDYSAYFNVQHELQRDEVEEAWQKRGIEPSTDLSIIPSIENKKEIIPLQDIEMEWDKKIGEGGFGCVYAGLWKKTTQDGEEKEIPIAFKQFVQQQCITKKKMEQLKKEIEIFISLDHPNIVRLFGIVLEKDHLGIVMEYLPKTLFYALFKEEIKFSVGDKKRIVGEIISALEYLHTPTSSTLKPQIAHCDMKSQNILLDGKNVAKLCDFGLSTVKNVAQTSSSRTSAVPGQGTPRYAAPEVLQGELLSMKGLLMSDIYSLTLVIYEILVEEEPYEDLNYAQLIENVGRKSLRPPLDDTNLTEPVKQLVMKGWDKTASSRPGIHEFSKELSGIDAWYTFRNNTT